MHDLTDSPLMVGLVTTATLGPVLMFSMLGGVVADRVNRLRVLRSTRAMFAILTIGTGVLIATDVIRPWHLIAISICAGVLLSFDIPCRSAMIPALVPRDHLASAIALYSLVFGGASIVGPILFPLLVNLQGMEGVFFLIGASYALTVVALAFMDPRGHTSGARRTTLVQGLVDGLRYVRQHRIIAGVITLGMIVGAFGSPFGALLPVYADKVVTGGIDTYSRLLLSTGIGGLVATVWVTALGTRVRPARFFVVSGIGFGLGLLMMSRIASFSAAAPTIGLIGAFSTVSGIMGSTLVQGHAADEYRGRVMSIHQFTWGANAIGAYMMGALGENLGVPVTLSLCGLVVAGATLVVALSFLRPLVTSSAESPSRPASSEPGSLIER